MFLMIQEINNHQLINESNGKELDRVNNNKHLMNDLRNIFLAKFSFQ